MPRNTLTFCAVLVAITLQSSIALAQLPTANRITCVLAVDHHAGDFDDDGGRWRTSRMMHAEDTFRNLVDEAGRAGNVPVQFETINNSRVTRNSILNTIRQARVDSSTTLVVYYHGHGATDGTRGHYLAPYGGDRDSVLRSEILDVCLERRSRPMLLILITDCCSGRGDISVLPAVYNPDREALLRNLFLQHRGVVDMTAASYWPEHTAGELGWGYFFTQGLIGAIDFAEGADFVLDSNSDGFVSWTEFLPLVQSQTNEIFVNAKQNNTLSGTPEQLRQTQQVPQAFCLGGRSDITTFSRNRPFRVGLSVWPDGDGGLVVKGVEANTPATEIIELNGRSARAGTHFVVGDHIDRVNGQRVPSLDTLYSVLDGVPRGATVRMTGRDGNSGEQYSAIIRLE